MRSWGILAAVSTLTLAFTGAALPGSAETSQAAAAGRVTASEPVAGSWDNFNETADIKVSPNGKWLLAATDKGLTKMSITRNHIATLGRNLRAKAGEIVVHPNSRVAYISYNRRLQVFNIAGKKPTLVRTLKFREKYVARIVARPDGKRLYAILDTGQPAGGGLQVVNTERPGHPKFGPYVEDNSLTDLAALPNSKRLVMLRRDDEDNRFVSVFDVSDESKLEQGELPLVAERNIVPEDIPTSKFTSAQPLLTPNGKNVYIMMGRYNRVSLAKFRVSDLKMLGWLPEPSARKPQTWPTVIANGGRRIYGLRALSDDQQDWPGRIVWRGSNLGKLHTLTGAGGRAHDLAMSPGGRTKGLLYALQDGKNGLRVVSIDPS